MSHEYPPAGRAGISTDAINGPANQGPNRDDEIGKPDNAVSSTTGGQSNFEQNYPDSETTSSGPQGGRASSKSRVRPDGLPETSVAPYTPSAGDDEKKPAPPIR